MNKYKISVILIGYDVLYFSEARFYWQPETLAFLGHLKTALIYFKIFIAML